MNNDNEVLECWGRIDNTLCLNNNKGNLEFGIDDEEHIDCDSVIGMIEDLETIKQALLELKSIKEANPSEALVCLDKLAKQIELDEDTDYWEIRNAHKTVEQALLKAQEPKQYLKWEDLDTKPYTMKVKMGDNLYMLDWKYSNDDDYDNSKLVTLRTLNGDWLSTLEKYFFNDLHLEMVEE